MTEVIVVIVLVALAVLVTVIVMSRRQRRGPAHQAGSNPSTPSDPFGDVGVAGDPRTLKAGDMVEYLGRRYFVRGSLRMSEGGYRWDEHLLDDTEGTKRWISVEEDPDLEVVLWTEYDHGDLVPDHPTITAADVEYRREEHGRAGYRSEGTTGLDDQGALEYVDYAGPGGRYLSFERYGEGPWESGLGETVPNGTLTIYPGS